MKVTRWAMLSAAIVFALLVVGCGKSVAGTSSTSSSGGGNTISMTTDNFVQHTLTVKAGTTVHFSDTNGGFHQICLGTNMKCDPAATGPSELEGSGFSINPPQVKDIVFSTPGTYQITCSVHPNMDVTVTVTP